MGLLNGHQGVAPTKLTGAWLDAAEQIARKLPCTLAKTERRLLEIHLDVPAHPGTATEEKWPVVYPNATLVEKKRHLGRFQSADDNLKCLQAAAHTDQVCLFNLDESGLYPKGISPISPASKEPGFPMTIPMPLSPVRADSVLTSSAP